MNDYAVVQISPRRFAVVKRRQVSSRFRVGYGKVTPRGGGQLGAVLEDPQYIENWTEYVSVKDHGNLTYEMALRAIYHLTRNSEGPTIEHATPDRDELHREEATVAGEGRGPVPG